LENGCRHGEFGPRVAVLGDWNGAGEFPVIRHSTRGQIRFGLFEGETGWVGRLSGSGVARSVRLVYADRRRDVPSPKKRR